MRLAYRLRERVPFGLTSYILGLFLVCFAVQRMIGYALWIPLGWLAGVPARHTLLAVHEYLTEQLK